LPKTAADEATKNAGSEAAAGLWLCAGWGDENMSVLSAIVTGPREGAPARRDAFGVAASRAKEPPVDWKIRIPK